MTDILQAPENKAASGPAADLHGEMLALFEAYKAENDRRLAEIDSRRGADPVTQDKVDRLAAALDDTRRRLDQISLRQARPLASGEPPDDGFDAYVRRGERRFGLDVKAMSAGVPSEGGYLVPDDTEAAIGGRLALLSPIRGLATVRRVSAPVLKKPFAVSGPACGWVGETAPRPQTATGTLAELQFPTLELYAMPAATQTLLDDAAVDIGAWLTAEIEAAFAEQEGHAFLHGDGESRPKGLLSYPSVAEAGWSWGRLGHVASGGAGAFAAANPSDRLVELIYALKPGYRQNAHFVMNRRTQAAIRSFKDANGAYLWQPPATPGARPMLMGFPLAEAEDMPDVAADAPAIAFGDFARGYLVVDRLGVRVLRDPYSAKPHVLFYVTKRVGGGVQDFDAIKLMKFSA